VSFEEHGFHGERLGQHLGMRQTPLLTVRHRNTLALTATRLSSYDDDRRMSAPTPVEDAFSIVHALLPLEAHERWKGGRRLFGGAFSAGTVSVVDLREPVEVVVRGPVQAIQFYVTRAVLDDFARESGVRPIATLVNDRSAPDRVVSSLSSLLLSAFAEDRPENRLFTDQLGLSLVAHFLQAYGGGLAPAAISGGLSPWQERRARDLLQERLAGQVTIAEIAQECQLTPSHFARAFRRSFGQAPHAYLTELRLERARELMLTTDLPLAQVALLCGFGDQSYFTRIFTRQAGTSPGLWRRSRKG
jgi:AraC family transcriptional regulator